MVNRRCTHAGSWYEDDRSQLNQELSQWLALVDVEQIPTPPHSVIDSNLPGRDVAQDDVRLPVPHCKAIIAPHAGYSYSGPAAAYAYRCIDPSKYKRVFILGPSHKAYLDGCALSACDTYDTPLGPLPLDKATIEELRNTGKFLRDMTKSVDENEHSIEMHLPYIRKVFENHEIAVVPILVGSTSFSQEGSMGKLLAPYLLDETTLFVISSDFCHWGTRFDFTHYKPDKQTKLRSLTRADSFTVGKPPIHSSIRALDGTAISHLTFPASLPIPDASNLPPTYSSDTASTYNSSTRTATQARQEFHNYLKETKNTICGRHPIGVLMGALAALEEQGQKMELRFTRYEQSSECTRIQDSSVSYASAFVRQM